MGWTVGRGAGIWGGGKRGHGSLSPPRIELQQDRASGGRALARSLVDDDDGEAAAGRRLESADW